ncbi:MAG TPA: c-type cytochrome [Asticcacaulis sp.]|nr:c-type cytochrome [Asticcacaulis sp.]
MLKVLLVIGAGGLMAGQAFADPVADGQAYFKSNCSACHANTATQTGKPGPTLYGVVGRKVGSVPGFSYSTTLKGAGLKGETWTSANLDVFLTNPQRARPGTYMPVSVANPASRAVLIAYLGSLTASAPGAGK